MLDLLPGKMLVFAHRTELVDQLIETLREWNPDWKIGKEMADEYADTKCDVIVSCNASIGRDSAKRLERFGGFDVVVCDEAHHSIASTYLNVFEQTGVLKPNSTKLLVGFTATPKRKNMTKKQKNTDDTGRRRASVPKVRVSQDCVLVSDTQSYQRGMASTAARVQAQDKGGPEQHQDDCWGLPAGSA